MNDLFNSLKNSNLIIILAVITAIILALIIIIIIEKIDKNKRKNDIEYYQEDFNVEEEYEDEIVYVDEEPTEEEAKKTLEEMQKKLVEEDDGLIGHTHFEIEQEEKSIISYEELKKAAEYVDETNDKLLEDEGTEPITIEELYKRHVENNEKEELENPIYEEEQKIEEIKEPVVVKEEPKKEVNNEKKFKNSEVISPVFGIYKQEAAAYRKVAPIQRQEPKQELNDIELEIEKTEAFLEELKNLKSKLR